MRDKNKLVKWYVCSLNDMESIKMYLEEMALKGWMLEKIRLRSLVFRRYQPQRIRYSVQIFSKTGYNDNGINKKNDEFIKECEGSDWHFVSSFGKIHVFCTTNQDAAEIHIDPETKLKYINLSLIKNSWPSIIFIIIWVENLTLNKGGLRDYTDPMWAIFTCIYTCLIALCLSYFITHTIWYIKARRNISKGKDLPKQGDGLLILITLFVAVAFGLLIFILILSESYLYLIVVSVGAVAVTTLALLNLQFKKIIKTKLRVMFFITIFFLVVLAGGMIQSIYGLTGIIGVGHQDAHGISYSVSGGGVGFSTVYNDPLPLTLSEIGVNTKGIYSKEKDFGGKFFATEIDYSEQSVTDDQPENISYSVYTTKYIWVKDKIIHYYLDGYSYEYMRFPNYKTVNVKGANKVYTAVTDNYYNYLMVYNDKVVFFQSDFYMNKNQIQTAVSKLK